MSLRHALLGLLATQPATGYELAQKFDKSLGTAWHASHSQIYPELARLADAGMVEVVGEGARNSRTYAVTEAGYDEIRTWLIETDANRSQRNETAVRWFLLGLLKPEDRRAAVDRELAYAEEYVANLRQIAEQIDAANPEHPFRKTVDLGLRTSSVMQDWLREQR
ncbi:PadR family transcriptional regulator [Solirubrobacter phytolaccae]|uniref:PadR family transcriptional regulator n=1 Tax=Solirubrobacter phytolaccae TaxID=1404360 RepID=A0A9X3N4C2_9ACTN|nr:PadR family transcriptional regulator [Solirubrobacter phytolaccae]MDA0179251.1 PadR family transcriptional regulator [Solirubrobacter phytolaccae]